MHVGEVRVAEDTDYAFFKAMCKNHEDWTSVYAKNNVSVWTKQNDVSDFKMIKIQCQFKDVSAACLYDVLHDPGYRKHWDSNMIDSFEICCLNPNNDIGYYALKTPKPLKKRDFVTQRSWLDLGTEAFIINHSVEHAACPPKKGYVRGISYLTGYYIVPMDGRKNTETGSHLYYVTQSDPKGKLPAWAVNKLTQWLAPKVVSRIHKACRNYPAWKAKHNAQYKPWLYPEQMTLPRLNPDDIKSIKEIQEAEVIDETVAKEIQDDELAGSGVDTDASNDV